LTDFLESSYLGIFKKKICIENSSFIKMAGTFHEDRQIVLIIFASLFLRMTNVSEKL